MKLLQINVTANWGSHGKIAEGIGNLAIKDGWNSYLAFGRYANLSQSELIKIGGKRDVYFHVAESRLFDNHGLASRRATDKFLKKIEELNPDIIHLHNIHGYYLNYPKLFEFLRVLQKPVVWTLHDCWAFTGHCVHPTFVECTQWPVHCVYPCPLRGEYPKSWIVDRCEKNFDLKKSLFNKLETLHIVTVSKWLENEVRKSYLKDKDIRCIYNGVDTAVFRPTNFSNLIHKHSIKSTEKVVLGVASLWEVRKGLKDFYSLRKLLPSSYRIILIGVSRKQIKELPQGIEGVIRTNSPKELAAYYSMADVYVNPSQAETFGMTTAEALACGTPAVVYDVTACPEVVDDITGRVVEYGDVERISENIKEICGIDDIKSVRDACVGRVQSLFNANKQYRKYLELYSELL